MIDIDIIDIIEMIGRTNAAPLVAVSPCLGVDVGLDAA